MEALFQLSLVVAAEPVRLGVNVIVGMTRVFIVLSKTVETVKELPETFTVVVAVGLVTVPTGATVS